MLPDNRNKKGTGFTNLSRILQASRGARLGGQVASGVKQTGQQVRGQIGKAGEQFQTKAQQEAKKFGTEAAKERESTIESITPVSGAQGVQPQQDQADLIGRFADWRSTEYKGPKGLEDYGSLAGKVTEAEELGRLGRTSGGKQELLRRFVGGRDYSQGEQRLDAALLGLTGQRELAQAQRETRGLGAELMKQTGLASEQAQQLAKQAKSFGEETLRSLGEKKKQILTGQEYGVGGKTLDEIFKETKAKEEGRSQLAKDIKDFNTYFQGLVSSGARTRDQQRDEFAKLLNKAKDQGYISQDEVSRLFDVRSMSGEYNPEYDLITRAQAVGLSPYDTLGALTTQGQAAQNLNLSGVLASQAPERAGQLKLLEQLAGTIPEQSEFMRDQGEYKAGTLGFEKGTPEFKLQVLDKETKKFQENINSVNSQLQGTMSKLGRDLTLYGGIGKPWWATETIDAIGRDLRSQKPIDFNNYPYFSKFKGSAQDALRNMVSNYNTLINNKNSLNANLNKAQTYKNQIEQQQASLNNPYVNKPNEPK